MNDDSSPDPDSLSYRAAGVDIDAGNALVERIKPVAARPRRPGVMAGLGGFGALFRLPVDRYREPVLVAGTDGVGTKLKLAIELDRHDDIGIDLVAMCVNDLIVQGAEPLFFLDYYATGRLDVDTAARVVAGIGRGCELAGAALIGGETAEMPGMYGGQDYDLAGFCVGVVERDRLIDGSRVTPGDTLIALASSGFHANGYSLIRRLIEVRDIDLHQPLDGAPLAERLLAPTRIYVKPLLSLLEEIPVHALAHITGGGLLENLPRVLPETARAVIEPWEWPSLFRWVQKQGNIETSEMLRTFNCGIGMVLCVAPEHVDETLARLAAAGEQAWTLGCIEARRPDEPALRLAG